jgi:hypothetical protein
MIREGISSELTQNEDGMKIHIYEKGRVAGIREVAYLLCSLPNANYIVGENITQLQELADKIEKGLVNAA